MKCMYNQSKRGLPSDVRTLALRVAKEMLALACQIVQAATGDKTIVGEELSFTDWFCMS